MDSKKTGIAQDAMLDAKQTHMFHNGTRGHSRIMKSKEKVKINDFCSATDYHPLQ